MQRYLDAKKFRDGHVLAYKDELDFLFKASAMTGKHVVVTDNRGQYCNIFNGIEHFRWGILYPIICCISFYIKQWV